MRLNDASWYCAPRCPTDGPFDHHSGDVCHRAGLHGPRPVSRPRRLRWHHPRTSPATLPSGVHDPTGDIRSVKPLRKIICWSSTSLTRTNGKPVVPGCLQRGFNVSHRIIRIGKCMGGRLRILMAIGWCSRMRRGPCEESPGTPWHCHRLPTFSPWCPLRGTWADKSMHNDHRTTPSPKACS
jgi:hypothetical protein